MWDPENVTFTPRPFQHLSQFVLPISSAFVCVMEQFCSAGISVWSFLLNYYLSHVLFNCIPYLSFCHTVYHLKVHPKISEETVKTFFFFQDVLSLFSLPLQLSFCHPNIYRQIPAQREREEGQRERERERERERKKKTNFLAFSRQWLSKKPPLAHRSWLHSFPNANQMWSTNVWQRFCFFLQRKTNVGQKCSLLAIRARWYKNKFRFIPEFQTFPHGGWDGTVWFRVIAMLLFGVGRVLWNIGIESGLWKATDEMWQLHFQLRLPSESFFIHMHTGSSSRARPQFSALQAPVRLWQIYVWSITKHASARAWAVLFVYLLYVFKSPYQILLIIEPRSFDIQAFQASCCTAFL